ncbi:hypothetical protein [Diplocloster hominis]|uniref:hypothetical protein n=1 Tax=Diplocloster hominis TaxID=3079010 RepID=UPI0031BBC310
MKSQKKQHPARMPEAAEPQKRKLRTDLLFIAGAALFFMIWAWQWNRFDLGLDGPDEWMRFDIIRYLTEHWELPRGDNPAIINPIWGFSYAFHPYIPHIISALFIRLVRFFTEDIHILVFTARLASVLFGAGTVWMSIKIAGKLLKDRADQWIFVFFITFLPQMVYLNAYVNCESMAIFSTAVLIYAWLRGMESRWDLKACVILGTGLALCALSYVTAYGFLVCSFLFFCLSILLCQDRKWDFKTLFQKGGVVLLVFLLLAGWWFIRNAVLYQGDFLGIRSRDLCGEIHAQDFFKPSLHPTYKKDGLSFLQGVRAMCAGLGWHRDTFKSFIGAFYDTSVRLPQFLYNVYKILFAAGILGCLLSFRELFSVRKDGRWRERGIFHWTLVLAVIIPNFLNLYASYAVDYQPQGRYSMPMLLPFLYFMTFGITQIIDRLIKYQRARNIIKGALCFGLLSIAVFALRYYSLWIQSQ